MIRRRFHALACFILLVLCAPLLVFEASARYPLSQARATITPAATPTPPFPGTAAAYYTADAGLYSDTGCTTPATVDGTAIACWADQSGNGYNLTQSTAGNRPVLKLNIANGSTMPVVRFDGVNDQLGNTAMKHVIGTGFVVANESGASFPGYNGAFTDGAGSDNNIMFVGLNTGTSWYQGGRFASNYGGNMWVDAVLQQNFVPMTTFHTSVGVSDLLDPWTAAVSTLQVGLDRGNPNGNGYWVGDIAAAGIYDTLLAWAVNATAFVNEGVVANISGTSTATGSKTWSSSGGTWDIDASNNAGTHTAGTAFAGFTTGTTAAQDCSYTIKAVNSGSDFGLIVRRTTTSGFNDYSLAGYNGAGAYAIWTASGGTVTLRATSAGGKTVNVNDVFRVTQNGGSNGGIITLYVNGTVQLTYATTAGLGGNDSGVGVYNDADASGVMRYGSLTCSVPSGTSNRTAVQTYLKAKWGTP